MLCPTGGGGRGRGGGLQVSIIYPVMALTTTQRPTGRDQSRSQQIRHTQQLSHTLVSAVRLYDAQPLREPSLGSFLHQSNQKSRLYSFFSKVGPLIIAKSQIIICQA